MTFPIRFSGKHLGDESRPKLLILLGALGEIRTNQPTYSIYKYFLAQSRTRGISRGSFGLQGCTEKCLSFKGFLMGEYLVSKKHPETHLRALFQLESGEADRYQRENRRLVSLR